MPDQARPIPYGDCIVQGLALNNRTLLLAGAIPAAALVLLAQGVFEAIERWLTPHAGNA